MPRGKPETVICTYRVRRGKLPAFKRLLARHWPTLRRLGLVTAERPRSFVGRDESGGTVVVEIFSWRDGRAVATAHENPEVLAIWERLEPLTEERQGRARWEFPHFRPLRLA